MKLPAAPANAPAAKSVKTNPAPPMPEKKPRASAAPRSKPSAPAPAPTSPTAKSVKTNSLPASDTTKTAQPVQAALPFDVPRRKPSPASSKPSPQIAASTTKNVKTPPAPIGKPKKIPVKSAKTAPVVRQKTVSHSVKVVNEPVLEGGALWKMSGKNGVAYIKDAIVAGELLATDPKNLPKRAMAVYYDKKGKAFAWQVRFDTSRWEEVMRRLG